MGDGMSKAVELTREDLGSLTESPRSESSGESSGRPNCKSAPADCLLIFDWDDTLLCSSAITMAKWNKDQLYQLHRTVEAVLRLAMELGETMIVTNGNASWVQDSARRFMPGLLSTLEEIEVISARAKYEEMYPGDPFAWKREAFQTILERRRCKAPDAEDRSSEDLNLVVLGDSPAEMEAAHLGSKVLGGSVLVKTVKFLEAPSVQQLLGQLNRICNDLEGLVNCSRSLSKRLEQCRGVPPHLQHITSWSSAWRLADGRDWSKPQSLAEVMFGKEEDVPVEAPRWMLVLGDKIHSWTKGVALKN
mmetsp:Transcript_82000/g.227359  ORF Transcript_82000/g.227359 Transcript_82000/m.227359 type:complete len:305 (+) Transcript_82000:137-1051(+)